MDPADQLLEGGLGEHAMEGEEEPEEQPERTLTPPEPLCYADEERMPMPQLITERGTSIQLFPLSL